MSTENAVTLSVPASMQVLLHHGPDGSMTITLTPAPAGRPSPAPPAAPGPMDALRQARAAAVVRRGRPPGSGKGRKGFSVDGETWHNSRARNAAIRAFADADPRFSRADYRSPGAPGRPEGYYISSRLRKAFEEAQAKAAGPAPAGTQAPAGGPGGA